MKKLYLILLVGAVLLPACTENRRFEKSPVDNLIKDLNHESSFSIILHDMDYDESHKQYKHQYQVLIEKPDTILSKTTEWFAVNEPFFNHHINNMGMEIVSKTKGKVNKTVSPAGYSNYVGNEKYGRWERRDGGNFWSFYGKYMFMSSMFNMATMPVRRTYWNDYYNNHYYNQRPYYGPTTNGSRMYGTNSSYSKQTRSNSTWNKKPNSFKQNVRSKASRSSGSSFYGKKSSSTRKSRSSSRYSSSSYRSRGGSSGK